MLETQPCFVFHHVNAFEAERPGQEEPLVVLDSVPMDGVDFNVNQYTYGPEFYQGTAGWRALVGCWSEDGAALHRYVRKGGTRWGSHPRVAHDGFPPPVKLQNTSPHQVAAAPIWSASCATPPRGRYSRTA